MKVTELSRDQLVSLKQHYLCESNADTSWYELAEADTIISDEQVMEQYADISFSEDDFFN